MKKYTLLIFLVVAMSFSFQTKDYWQLLFKVKYGNWRENFNPIFPEEVKKLNGKKIQIKGFLIPMEKKPKHNFFLLSAFPYDACFYCGKAGPESVIEVTCPKAVKFTESMITIEGTLQLNSDSPEHLFYIIKDGVLK